MREREAEFQAKGANLAAIGLGNLVYAIQFREDSDIDFPLFIDEQREAYKAAGLKTGNVLHIFRSDNVAHRKKSQANGFKQHKMGENPFQLGGSFVFGPGDEDWYIHTSETFGDNAPISELLAALD